MDGSTSTEQLCECGTVVSGNSPSGDTSDAKSDHDRAGEAKWCFAPDVLRTLKRTLSESARRS